MNLQGERVIKAHRAAVWQALNDPDMLRACIPGCDELEKTSENSFEGQVTQKVGPVKAKFKGAVTLSDIVEGESYRIDGEGKGGAAGFVKGGADVRLEDAEDGGTRLSYEADWKVGGKLAQLGNRLVDSFARKNADLFFDRFKEEVERPGSEDSVTPPVDQAPDDLVAAEAAPGDVAEETAEAQLSDHPLDAPGAAGPATRDAPVSGASAEDDQFAGDGPQATAAGAGPAGGTEGTYQTAMSKKAAEMAARQQDPAADTGRIEDDPARGPADAPERGGTDGGLGGAGSDPARVAGRGASDKQPPRGAAPEGPKKAAPKAEPPQSGKKSWFQRLFGR